jgi:hypothetical protein
MRGKTVSEQMDIHLLGEPRTLPRVAAGPLHTAEAQMRIGFAPRKEPCVRTDRFPVGT